MGTNCFELTGGNRLIGWNPSWGETSIQGPKSHRDHGPIRLPMLTCIGFGSRGGFRETGVVRRNEPMEKPTASTPIWPSQPVGGDHEYEEASQTSPTAKTTIQ